MTGESLTAAVTAALPERLDRLQRASAEEILAAIAFDEPVASAFAHAIADAAPRISAPNYVEAAIVIGRQAGLARAILAKAAVIRRN